MTREGPNAYRECALPRASAVDPYRLVVELGASQIPFYGANVQPGLRGTAPGDKVWR